MIISHDIVINRNAAPLSFSLVIGPFLLAKCSFLTFPPSQADEQTVTWLLEGQGKNFCISLKTNIHNFNCKDFASLKIPEIA